MTPQEQYAATVAAWTAQSAKYRGTSDDRWSDAARRFRRDPHRPLEPHLQAVGEYLRSEDVLVDVGGGAGRECLPLALRCRSVVCVDPSPGMEAEFETSAVEAGITNARFVRSGWTESERVTGDILLCSNVTYFVGDIEPFVRKLQAAAGRRVIIEISSVPPPNIGSDVFLVVRGETASAGAGAPRVATSVMAYGNLARRPCFSRTGGHDLGH